jgi:hypothetical protein
MPDTSVRFVVSDLERDSSVTTWVRQDWQFNLGPRDIEYLEAMFEDWGGTPRRDVAGLFKELKNLPYGPLRVLDEKRLQSEAFLEEMHVEELVPWQKH